MIILKLYNLTYLYQFCNLITNLFKNLIITTYITAVISAAVFPSELKEMILIRCRSLPKKWQM